MKTTELGRQAEDAVAGLLEQHGFEILARNWRTRVCEIDIIAQKKGVIYFVEAKYRTSPAQGDGFEYITSKKLKQMEFAAQMWLQHNGSENDWRLMAASVSGLDFEEIELVEV